MTATATAPVTFQDIEARYDSVAMSMIEREEAGMPVYLIDNSPEWYAIEKILRRWAVVVYADHVDKGEEIDRLDDMLARINEQIHASITGWAAEERRRDVARDSAA